MCIRDRALADSGEEDELLETSTLGNEILVSAGMQFSEEPKTRPTVQKQPKKARQELTEKQKEMMSNICSRLNCSEELVLRSFRECPGEERYDYERWCFHKIDEEGEEDEDDESSDDDDADDEEGTNSSDDESEAKAPHGFKYTSGKGAYIAPTHILHSCGCIVN